jgi:hypothetical protein
MLPVVDARVPVAHGERASMIVTSNKPLSAWGEIFRDAIAATAMVDRLIHHAEILSAKGDSYRLKDRDLGPRPTRPGGHRLTARPPAFGSARLRLPPQNAGDSTLEWPSFHRRIPRGGQFSTGATGSTSNRT